MRIKYQSAVFTLNFMPHISAPFGDRRDQFVEVWNVDLKVTNRPPDVTREQAQQLLRRRRKAADTAIAIQDQDRECQLRSERYSGRRREGSARHCGFVIVH